MEGSSAEASPTQGRGIAKWWHVGDEKIEEMVRRLKPSVTAKSAQAKPKARTFRDHSSPEDACKRSVSFDEPPLGDALDEALRQSACEGLKAQQGVARKRGAWKVSDEQFAEFLQNASQAYASSSQPDADEGIGRRSFSHAGRTALGRTGDCVLGGPGSASAGALKGPSRRPVPRPSDPVVAGDAQRRSKDSKSRLAMRPQWVSHSAPNIFAGVGVGLDGKGNKIIKSANPKFEENPIYLGDLRDRSLSRVRVAVCGHPAYMR